MMAMAILLIADQQRMQQWQVALQSELPDIPVFLWPSVPDNTVITMVIGWRCPKGVLQRFTNLRLVASMGAGVDDLVDEIRQLDNVQLLRVVNPHLAQDMLEHVIALISSHCRSLYRYWSHQQQQHWQPEHYLRFGQLKVGVMGLGNIGCHVATGLSKLGFTVRGWSRSKPSLEGIETYSEIQLNQFVSGLDCLVCCLPLTQQTQRLIDNSLLAKLTAGALLVNVGRGQHVCEKSVLSALDNQQLSAAYLDVFDTEPLPAGHAFWRHPRVFITPHIASLTDVATAAQQVAQAYRAYQQGDRPAHLIDLTRGY